MEKEILVIEGDFNGHIRSKWENYETSMKVMVTLEVNQKTRRTSIKAMVDAWHRIEWE